MKPEAIQERSIDPLLAAVIAEFGRGIDMIMSIDDSEYRRVAHNTGSVGGHFRHNLDFATSYLRGIETGQIDYNLRERDPRIEVDREYAAVKIGEAIVRLAELTENILDRSVYVRSEVTTARCLASSVGRELEFLHSHTVHHHALIAEKLAGFEIKVSKNFGVAPSTLEYWKRKRREIQEQHVIKINNH